MSDYLTPRQIEVYERLIKKLLQYPHIVWNSRMDMSQDEWEQLAAIDHESPNVGVSCSAMASHIRELISKATASTLPPVSEKVVSMSESVAVVNEMFNKLAATDSLYSILLKIYDHPKISRLGSDLWLMDIHIGNAVRNYAAQERDNMVKFLKGFPQPTETPSDF